VKEQGMKMKTKNQNTNLKQSGKRGGENRERFAGDAGKFNFTLKTKNAI